MGRSNGGWELYKRQFGAALIEFDASQTRLDELKRQFLCEKLAKNGGKTGAVSSKLSMVSNQSRQMVEMDDFLT